MLDIEEGVIYTRVSSQRQVSEGNGLEGQLRSCQNFAMTNGIKIINHVILISERLFDVRH